MMMSINRYFQKAGGIKLLKQYWKAGVLHIAIIQFLVLGRSQTALLQLRETVTLKTQQRLRRKYIHVLEDFDRNYVEQPTKSCRRVWIFWWQGMEEAPSLVKKCYKSVQDNLGKDWDITLITEDNYLEYASFPEYILEKLKKGQITLTHFSDLLRLELLIKHGGLWLDATVLCTSGKIPLSILNAELFVFQTLKPGADGHATIMSSWLMFAKTNNKILIATRELLYDYWKKNTALVDYFLLHQFFTIVCERYPEAAKKIPPFCNSVPHVLLLHLLDGYDEKYWNDLKRMTCFHKLSYKLEKEDLEKGGTFYDKLINGGLV